MKILPKLKDDPATFYSYAKSFAVTRSDRGPLPNENGDLTQDENEMAKLLASQYKSMWTVPKTNLIREDLGEFSYCNGILDDNDVSSNYNEGEHGDGLKHNPEETKIVDIEITLSRIEEALSMLSNNASPGPDSIPTT